MDEPPALDPRDEPFGADAAGPGRDGSSPEPGAEGGPGRERSGRLAELRAAVEQGLEDIRAGRVVDLDEAFDRIEGMLDEIEGTGRS